MPTLSDPCEKRYSDEYLDQLDIKLTKLIKKKSRKQKNQIPKKKIDVFETKIVDDVQDLWLKYSPFQKSDEFHSNSIEIFNEISIKSDVLKRENDDLKAFFDFLITTKVV